MTNCWSVGLRVRVWRGEQGGQSGVGNGGSTGGWQCKCPLIVTETRLGKVSDKLDSKIVERF